MASDADIAGYWYAANTSRRLGARLRVSGTAERHATVLAGEGNPVSSAPFEAVVFGDRIGSAPRRLSFPDGSVFETEEHDAITALEGETRAGLLHRWETFHPRLLAVVGVGLVGVWGIWRYGLDLMAAAAVALTPAPLLTAMDAGTLKTIDTVMASPTTLPDAERARIRAIFADLAAAVPEDDIARGQELRLLFRRVPGVGPNAFAMPGGTVVMTDAFATAFPDEDIIAGVLGHEIGHVIEEHGLRQVYKSLGIYVLVALMAGDTGPVLEDILLEGNLLLSLSFSRESERAADAFGVALVREAGYDPRGLQKFFVELIKQVGDDSGWRATHPSSSERVEEIGRLIER
jgi:Zn-dependent protease with chaperone function